jgi:HSP20 family protein
MSCCKTTVPANRFWSDFFNKTASTDVVYKPQACVKENDGVYEVEVELPGVKKEDISVRTESGVLIIQASRKRGEAESRYERRFRLSDELDAENIQASHENGVLRLEVKRKPEAAPKSITIQ